MSLTRELSETLSFLPVYFVSQSPAANENGLLRPEKLALFCISRLKE
jgi:hypothetical protein